MTIPGQSECRYSALFRGVLDNSFPQSAHPSNPKIHLLFITIQLSLHSASLYQSHTPALPLSIQDITVN